MTQTTFCQDRLVSNLEVGFEEEGQQQEEAKTLTLLEDQVLLGEATIKVESELEVVGVEVAGVDVAGRKATVMFLQWQCGVRYRLIQL